MIPSLSRPLAFIRHLFFAFRLSTLSLALFLSSCVANGVVGFAKNGSIAVVSDRESYVVSPATGEILFYAPRLDARFTPALAPDGKSVVYIDQQKRLLRQTLDGSEPKVLTSPVALPGPGALAFLPNGDVMLLDTKFENEERYLMVFNVYTGEQPIPTILGMQQIFVSVNGIKSKTAGANAAGYSQAAKLDATTPGQFRVVFQAKNFLYLYSAEEKGLVYNETLPRVLDANDQLLLTRRIQEDAMSGLLTADGKWLVLRVRGGTPFGTATSLYALNLKANEPAVPILVDVPIARRLNYAVSPNGHFVAYEDLVNNIPNIQVHNLDTGQKTSLGIGTLDPKWWK